MMYLSDKNIFIAKCNKILIP